MRYRKLFFARDAAHIIPPTGAKSLNLAVSDVYYLARAFVASYESNNARYLDTYSDIALRRVWGAVRLSWWLTNLLNRFPNESEFECEERIKED